MPSCAPNRTGADFSCAAFGLADLTGARLAAANMAFSNPDRVNLPNVHLAGVLLERTCLGDPDFIVLGVTYVMTIGALRVRTSCTKAVAGGTNRDAGN